MKKIAFTALFFFFIGLLIIGYNVIDFGIPDKAPPEEKQGILTLRFPKEEVDKIIIGGTSNNEGIELINCKDIKTISIGPLEKGNYSIKFFLHSGSELVIRFFHFNDWHPELVVLKRSGHKSFIAEGKSYKSQFIKKTLTLKQKRTEIYLERADAIH